MSSLVESLIKLGFSYEDLYNKGILTEAAQEPKPEPAADPQPEPAADPEPAVDPQLAPDKSEDWKAAIDQLREDVKGMIQTLNIQQATRTTEQEQLTIEDAILGLTKGV